MKALRVAICVFVFLVAVPISRAQSPGNEDDKLSGVAMLLPQHHHSDASPPTFTLDEVEQMALAGNPEIRVAARRLAVVEANLPSAGALDDPSFMYRGWQVPLRSPGITTQLRTCSWSARRYRAEEKGVAYERGGGQRHRSQSCAGGDQARCSRSRSQGLL